MFTDVTNGKTKILLVDDDFVDRLAITRHAEKHCLPYEFTEASKWHEALLLLDEDEFDIVLLDQNLGSVTGLEFIDKFGKIPVILITGEGNEDMVVKALRSGAKDYVPKDAAGAYLHILPERKDRVGIRKTAVARVIRASRPSGPERSALGGRFRQDRSGE